MNFNNVNAPFSISKEVLLSKVSEIEIFYRYFGKFELKKIYSSPFRKDDHPSFGFYYNIHGEVISNDIKTGEKLDCIAFVAKLYNINYYQAMQVICQDFDIFEIPNVLPFVTDNSKFIKKSFEFDEKFKKKTLVQILPKNFSQEEIEFFLKREITEKELIENNILSVNKLFINKIEISSTQKIRVAFTQKDEKGNTYFKIYQPFSKKYKWISNIPLSLPFGIDSLTYDTDTLVITKGQKERLILKKIYKDVIATQNESLSSFQKCLPLLNKYKETIVCYDADEPGVTACKLITDTYNLKYFNTPKYLLDEGIKDIDKYVEKFGLEALKKRLKEKKLL